MYIGRRFSFCRLNCRFILFFLFIFIYDVSHPSLSSPFSCFRRRSYRQNKVCKRFFVFFNSLFGTFLPIQLTLPSSCFRYVRVSSQTRIPFHLGESTLSPEEGPSFSFRLRSCLLRGGSFQTPPILRLAPQSERSDEPPLDFHFSLGRPFCFLHPFFSCNRLLPPPSSAIYLICRSHRGTVCRPRASHRSSVPQCYIKLPSHPCLP